MKKYDTDVIMHVADGDLQYLKFRQLEPYKNKLINAVTLRHGGVGKNEFESLSFSFKVNEKIREDSFKNLNIICSNLGINSADVCKSNMNHTNKVLILNELNKDKYRLSNFCSDEYDAYITKCKNIPIMINTADCIPIIFYDTSKNIVGLVHAGWRGVVSKIHREVIECFLSNFNSNVDDIIVCIGPCIRKCCFSSKDIEFKNIFTNIWENGAKYIEFLKDGTFYIDIVKLVKNDLIDMGVSSKNIQDSNICTKCNSEDFFSNRVQKQLGFSHYGLFATIVMLK